MARFHTELKNPDARVSREEASRGLHSYSTCSRDVDVNGGKVIGEWEGELGPDLTSH